MKIEIKDNGEVMFVPQNVREEHGWMPLGLCMGNMDGYLLPVPGKYGQQVICYLPPLPPRRI